jgi:hypothetical protein
MGKGLLGILGICLLAVGMSATIPAQARESHSAQLRYRIGPLHRHQSSTSIVLTISNRGGVLPHLVVVLSSFHTWQMTKSLSKEGENSSRLEGRVVRLSSSRYLWDFGRLPARRSAYLRLTVLLETRTAVEVNVATYARAHRGGSPIYTSVVTEASTYAKLGLPRSG